MNESPILIGFSIGLSIFLLVFIFVHPTTNTSQKINATSIETMLESIKKLCRQDNGLTKKDLRFIEIIIMESIIKKDFKKFHNKTIKEILK